MDIANILPIAVLNIIMHSSMHDYIYGEFKMSVTISLPDDVYQRLERLAVGFDTPVRVIERLLDEGSAGFTKARPTLTFSPDESAFKHELLISKKAQVVLHLKSGGREVLHWNASRFKSSSNLRANLWLGFLRDWKDKGITSAELSVLPKALNSPDDDTGLQIAIAKEVRWTLEEVEQYFIECEEICSDDGLPYYNLAKFSEETPSDLKELAGLNSSNEVHLDLHFVPIRGDEEEI